MATHIINNAQKVVPADKTFCDLPPSRGRRRGARSSHYHLSHGSGFVCGRAKLREESSSCVEAE